MGVSDEAKNVIPLKFLRKIKNKNFCPLVNSIRGHTVYRQNFFLAVQHSCLSLKITHGLAPSCNFLATSTRVSGLVEKISGNISASWYIIKVFF
jgi:hypothetical protein